MFLFLILFQWNAHAEPIALGRSDTSVEKPAKKDAQLKPPEWIVLESELQSLTTQIRQRQGNLNRLIQEKRSTEDRARLSEIIRELNAEQRGLKSLVEDYDQQRTVLRYRYPERRSSGQRKYEKIEVKPIEDLESQTVLDRRLHSARTKIEKVYAIQQEPSPPLEKTTDTTGGGRAPASVGGDVPVEPVTRPVRKNFIRLIDETPMLKR